MSSIIPAGRYTFLVTDVQVENSASRLLYTCALETEQGQTTVLKLGLHAPITGAAIKIFTHQLKSYFGFTDTFLETTPTDQYPAAMLGKRFTASVPDFRDVHPES